jgi:hypothetical protein
MPFPASRHDDQVDAFSQGLKRANWQPPMARRNVRIGTGHYARPDVTRLLFNNRPANRVEMLTLPVNQVSESPSNVEPRQTTTPSTRESADPTPRPVAAE